MPEEQFVLQAVRTLRKARCAYLSSRVHVNKGSAQKMRHIHLTIVSEHTVKTRRKELRAEYENRRD
jgi:hypothetical protein